MTSTEDKIINAALEVFVNDGFHASTSSITKKAGVSTGLLFHYFPTKNDLIAYLYKLCFLESFHVSVRPSEMDVPENISDYMQESRISFEASVKWRLENWQRYQYMKFFEASVLFGQLRVSENEEIRNITKEMNSVIQGGRSLGFLKNIAPVNYILRVYRSILDITADQLHEYPESDGGKSLIDTAWRLNWICVGGEMQE